MMLAAVVPARAGMTPMLSTKVIRAISGPRTSGDDPEQEAKKVEAETWSPHERG